MDDWLQPRHLVFLVPLIAFGVLGWRALRYGGLTGALVGARVRRTLGEVSSSGPGSRSRTLSVQLLDVAPGAEPSVLLLVASRATMSSTTTPIAMSRADARALAQVLNQVPPPDGGS